MRISLDAGHGKINGKNSGARSIFLNEDDYAFDMASRIGHYLREKNAEVVLTRPDKNIVPINTRAKIAVAKKCDFFLSIHANAAGSPLARGKEIFVAHGDARSRTKAIMLLESINKLKNRGVKWDDESAHSQLGVLRGTYKHMYAMLLELGFLSSPLDAALMLNKYVKDAWAKSIANEIIYILNN